MKQICVYNYIQSFDCELIEEIIKLIKDKKVYFLSRNWEGGPHIQIIFSEGYPNERIEIISEKIKKIFCRKIISKEIEESIKKKYEESSNILVQLEKKTKKVPIRDHGSVEVREYDFYYNNDKMTFLFIEKRFELQEILTKTFLLLNKNSIDVTHLFPNIFSRISDIYSVDGINKGYFSFISHVHGFFELSNKQNKEINEKQFEDFYIKNLDSIKVAGEEYHELIDEWYKVFEKIYTEIKLNLENIIDEAYKKNLEETVSSLEIEYKNDFHKNFVKFSKNTSFLENDKATAYRFLVNILYLTLPFFRISAYKKQKFIYMAYRMTEEKKGVTWREEIGIVN